MGATKRLYEQMQNHNELDFIMQEHEYYSKKWLNKDTPEWLEVLKDIKEGTFTSVWMLRSKYKISKEIEQEIESLL